MNARVMARQQAQMAFVASGENLVVGSEVDCPLPPDELAALTPDSSLVVEQFGGGLTARVLHLQIDGKHYTLKQKRHEALVRNVDGETSFLNEVQRRADFTRLKSDPVWEGRFAHIVPTLYADFRRGIILSPWLEGKPLDRFDGEIFEQILATAIACEEAGLMEWDLCPGNIIDDNGFIWLFDFGYMYPFDPCCEFNSNGLSDPLFHACERFETRHFFGWLLRNPQGLSLTQQMGLYRCLKQIALKLYQEKRRHLAGRGAKAEVLAWLDKQIAVWQQALVSEEALARLFAIENFRSQVLDIEDDLHGKSCSAMTLKRIDFVTAQIADNYVMLLENGALFYANEGKSQAELMHSYREKEQLARSYQLAP